MSKATLILLSLLVFSGCASRTQYYFRNTTEETVRLEVYFNDQLREQFDSPGWYLGGIWYEIDSINMKPNEMDVRRYSELHNVIFGKIVDSVKTVYVIPDSTISHFANKEGLKLYTDSVKLALPDTAYYLWGDRKSEVKVKRGGLFDRWICFVL